VLVISTGEIAGAAALNAMLRTILSASVVLPVFVGFPEPSASPPHPINVMLLKAANPIIRIKASVFVSLPDGLVCLFVCSSH